MLVLGKKPKKTKESEEEPADGEKIAIVDLLGSPPKGPEQRSIMFVGEINEEKAADLVAALLVLSQEKEKDAERGKDIKLYISTYGGSAHEMFAIYDVMNYCKQYCDIEAIGIGKVMSAGTLILAAGTPGKRKLGPNCQVMIHAVNGGSIGELHSLENEMEQMKNLQDTYIQCLSNETSMTKRQILTLINRKVNVYLSSDEAIEKGLADGVL